MNTLLAWLTEYGYAGLFVALMLGIAGLPIPDETLLVFCGYLVFRGRLSFLPAFLSGWAGSICGMSLSYYLGQRFGLKVVHRYGKYVRIRYTHIEHVERWFARFGPWSLSMGYFVPGVRHFTALVAGMSRLHYGKFAAFAYTGGAIWAGFFLTLGYIFGERWENTSALVHRYTLMGTGAAIVVGALVWLVRWLRGRRTPAGGPPATPPAGSSGPDGL